MKSNSPPKHLTFICSYFPCVRVVQPLFIIIHSGNWLPVDNVFWFHIIWIHIFFACSVYLKMCTCDKRNLNECFWSYFPLLWVLWYTPIQPVIFIYYYKNYSWHWCICKKYTESFCIFPFLTSDLIHKGKEMHSIKSGSCICALYS